MVGTQIEFDAALELCTNEHRRILLAELAGRQEPISIDALTESIAEHNHHQPLASVSNETATRIRTALVHTHLPKIAAAGLIEYDIDRGVVEPTADLYREGTHLSAILEVDPALEPELEL